MPFEIIAIGVSYDEETLARSVKDGTINESLAKRLRKSHLSKTKAMKYLRESCNLKNCREIHLLHMSGSNIDRESTRQWFEDELFIPTFAGGKYDRVR